jgi:hypothetical protein
MLILSGAYGRDYKSKKALLADFHADKDFIIRNCIGDWASESGRYINKPQVLQEGIARVQFRFSRDTKQAVIEMGGK